MKTVRLRRLSAAMLSFALALSTVACGGKINQENYSKVNTGMSAADVEAILGPGTEQASTAVAVPAMPNMPNVPGMPATTPAIGAPGTTVSTRVMTWKQGGKMISVTLVNDKVVSKAQVGL
jgi:hypothetical protein